MMSREHHRRRSPESPGRRREQRYDSGEHLQSRHHIPPSVPTSIPPYRESFPPYQQYQQSHQQPPQDPYQISYQEPSRELYQPLSQPNPPSARERERALSGGYSSSSSFTSSTSSSLLNISRPSGKFGIGNFFSGGAAKHRRRVRKKRSKFLRFGNSSSSSVGSDLAYGRGYIERRRSREFRSSSGQKPPPGGSHDLERPRPPKRAQTDEEIIELGRQFAEIARQQNAEDLRAAGKTRPSTLAGATTALKQFRRSNSGNLNRGIISSKPRRDSSSDDSDWESTSSDDESSEEDVDSGLAYGSSHSLSGGSVRQSRVETSIQSTQAYSHDMSLNRKPSVIDPKLFGPVNSLRGFVQTPCGFGPVDHDTTGNARPRYPSLSPSDTAVSDEDRPLKHVYPVPTADPSRIDAGRGSIFSAHSDSVSRSRPEPVPIQQPKPIAPVHAKVFESVETEQNYPKRSSPDKAGLRTSGIGLPSGSAGPIMSSDAAIGGLLRAALRDRSKLQEARTDDRQWRSQRSGEEKRDTKYGMSDSHDTSRDIRSENTDEQAIRIEKIEKLDRREEESYSEHVFERQSRRHDEYRVKPDQTEHVQQHKDDLAGDQQIDRREIRREATYEYQSVAQETKNDTPMLSEQPRTIPSKAPIDPFQFQVADDAFDTSAVETSVRPLTPMIVAVEREPDFSNFETYKRPSRKESFDRELQDVHQAYEAVSRATVSESKTTESTAAAEIVEDRHEGSPGEDASFDERSCRPDSSSQPRDPVLDDADRAYREATLKRRLREQEERSRSNSPNRSVVEKWKDEEESTTLYQVTSPPVVDQAKQKSPYDGPNADVRIDNVLEHPREIFRFQALASRRRSSTFPVFSARDPSAERERPMLNLVRPTPAPSPSPEKQQPEESQVLPHTAKDDTGLPSAEVQEDESSAVSTRIARAVSWGENQTKHYVVESPEREDDRSSQTKVNTTTETTRRRTKKKRDWGAIAAAVSGAGVVVAASSISGSVDQDAEREPVEPKDRQQPRRRKPSIQPEVYDNPPIPGPKPANLRGSQTPGRFAEDLEFMANIAAGLEGSGFDPNIVIDDAKFHRRDSPPGSNEPAEFSTEVSSQVPTHSDPEPEFAMAETEDTSVEERDIAPRKSRIFSDLSRKKQLEEQVVEEQVSDLPMSPATEDPLTETYRSDSEEDWDVSARKVSRKQKKRQARAEIKEDRGDDQVPADSSSVWQEFEPITADLTETFLEDKTPKWPRHAAMTREDSAQDSLPEIIELDDFAAAPEDERGPPREDYNKSKGSETRDSLVDRSLPLSGSVSGLSRESSYNVVESGVSPITADERDLPEKAEESESAPAGMAHLPGSFDVPEFSEPVEERPHRDEVSGRVLEDRDMDEWDLTSKTPSLSRHTTLTEDVLIGQDDIAETSYSPRSEQTPASEEEWEDLPKSKKKKKKKKSKRDTTTRRKSSSPTASRSASVPEIVGAISTEIPKESSLADSPFIPAPPLNQGSEKTETKREEYTSAPSGLSKHDDFSSGATLPERERELNQSELEQGASGSSLFDRLKSSIGLTGERRWPREAGDGGNSFLDNAGAVGASAGLMGAVIALTQQKPLGKAIDTALDTESQEIRSIERQPSPPRQPSPIDPEIVERKIRPAIDPMHGDLLPLPPSRSDTPLPVLDDSLPPLPESRPGTPEDERERLLLSHMSHVRRRSDSVLRLKTPSPGSIPIRFRLGRSGHPASPVATSPEMVTAPKSRSRPISWESSKDFKPLLLVERTSREPVQPPTSNLFDEMQKISEGPEGARDISHTTPTRISRPLYDLKEDPMSLEVIAQTSELPQSPPLGPVEEHRSPSSDPYTIDPVSKNRSSYLLYSSPPTARDSDDAGTSESSPTLRTAKVRTLHSDLKENVPDEMAGDDLLKHHDRPADSRRDIEILPDVVVSDKSMVLGETIDTAEKSVNDADLGELSTLPFTQAKSSETDKIEAREIEPPEKASATAVDAPVEREILLDTDVPDSAWAVDQTDDDFPSLKFPREAQMEKQEPSQESTSIDNVTFEASPPENDMSDKLETSASVEETNVEEPYVERFMDVPIETPTERPTMPSIETPVNEIIEVPAEGAIGTLPEAPFEAPKTIPIEASVEFPVEDSVEVPTVEVPIVTTEEGKEERESQAPQHEAGTEILSTIPDSHSLKKTMPPVTHEGSGSVGDSLLGPEEAAPEQEKPSTTFKDIPSTSAAQESEPRTPDAADTSDEQPMREVHQDEAETPSSKVLDGSDFMIGAVSPEQAPTVSVDNLLDVPVVASEPSPDVQYDALDEKAKLVSDPLQPLNDIVESGTIEVESASEEKKLDLHESKNTSPIEFQGGNLEPLEVPMNMTQSPTLDDVDESLVESDGISGVESQQKPKQTDAFNDPPTEGILEEPRTIPTQSLEAVEPTDTQAATVSGDLISHSDQLTGTEVSEVTGQLDELQSARESGKNESEQQTSRDLPDVQETTATLPTIEDVEEQLVEEPSSAEQTIDALPSIGDAALHTEPATLSVDIISPDTVSSSQESDKGKGDTRELDADASEEAVKPFDPEENVMLHDQNVESEKSAATRREQDVDDILPDPATLTKEDKPHDDGNLTTPTGIASPSWVEAEESLTKGIDDMIQHELELSSPSATEAAVPIEREVPEVEVEVKPASAEGESKKDEERSDSQFCSSDSEIIPGTNNSSTQQDAGVGPQLSDTIHPPIEQVVGNTDLDITQPMDNTEIIPLSSIPDALEQVKGRDADDIAMSIDTEKFENDKRKKRRSVQFADPIDESRDISVLDDAAEFTAPELTAEPDEMSPSTSYESPTTERPVDLPDLIEAQPIDIDPATIALPTDEDPNDYLPQEEPFQEVQPSIQQENGRSLTEQKDDEAAKNADQILDPQVQDDATNPVHIEPHDTLEAPKDIARQSEATGSDTASDMPVKVDELASSSNNPPPTETVPALEDPTLVVGEEETPSAAKKSKKGKKKRKSKSQESQEIISESPTTTALADQEASTGQVFESDLTTTPGELEVERSEPVRTEAEASIGEPVPVDATPELSSKRSKKSKKKGKKGIGKVVEDVPTPLSDVSTNSTFDGSAKAQEEASELPKPIQEGQRSVEESNIPKFPTGEQGFPLTESPITSILPSNDKGPLAQDGQETGAPAAVQSESDIVSIPTSVADDFTPDAPTTLPVMEPEQSLEAPTSEQKPSESIVDLADQLDIMPDKGAEFASDVQGEVQEDPSLELPEDKAVPAQDIEARTRETDLPHHSIYPASVSPVTPADIDIDKSTGLPKSSKPSAEPLAVESEANPEDIEWLEKAKDESHAISLDDEPSAPEPVEPNVDFSLPVQTSEDAERTTFAPSEEPREDEAAASDIVEAVNKDMEDTTLTELLNASSSEPRSEFVQVDSANADQIDISPLIEPESSLDDGPPADAVIEGDVLLPEETNANVTSDLVPAPTSETGEEKEQASLIENESDFPKKLESFPDDELPRPQDAPQVENTPISTPSKTEEDKEKEKTIKSEEAPIDSNKTLVDPVSGGAEQSGADVTIATQGPGEDIAVDTTGREDTTQADVIKDEGTPSSWDVTGSEVIPQHSSSATDDGAPRHENDLKDKSIIKNEGEVQEGPAPTSSDNSKYKAETEGSSWMDKLLRESAEGPVEVTPVDSAELIDKVTPVQESANDDGPADISPAKKKKKDKKKKKRLSLSAEEAPKEAVVENSITTAAIGTGEPVSHQTPALESPNDDSLTNLAPTGEDAPEEKPTDDLAATVPASQIDYVLVDSVITEPPVPDCVPEPVLEPASEPALDTAPESAPEPVPELAPESAPKFAPEPVPEATLEPAPETVCEPVPEPAPESTPESTPKSAPEPVPEATLEPASEPALAPEPMLEPAPEAVPELTPEPALESAPESVPGPSNNDDTAESPTKKSTKKDKKKKTKKKQTELKGQDVAEVVPPKGEANHEASIEDHFQEKLVQEKPLLEDSTEKAPLEELPREEFSRERPAHGQQPEESSQDPEEQSTEDLSKEVPPLEVLPQQDLPKDDLLPGKVSQEDPLNELHQEGLSGEGLFRENTSQDLPHGTPPEESLEKSLAKDAPQVDIPKEELRHEDTAQDLPQAPLPEKVIEQSPSIDAPQEDISNEDLREEEPDQEDSPQEDMPKGDITEDLPREDVSQELRQEGGSKEGLSAEVVPQVLAGQNLPPGDGPEEALPPEDIPREDSPEKDLLEEDLAEEDLPEEDLPEEDLPSSSTPLSGPIDRPSNIRSPFGRPSGILGLFGPGMRPSWPFLSRRQLSVSTREIENSTQEQLPKETLAQEDLALETLPQDVPPEDSPKEDLAQELLHEDLPEKVQPVEVPPQEDIRKEELSKEVLFQEESSQESPHVGIPQENLPGEELSRDDLLVEAVPGDGFHHGDSAKEDLPRQDLPQEDLSEALPQEDLREGGLYAEILLPQPDIHKDLRKEELRQVPVQEDLGQKELTREDLPKDLHAEVLSQADIHKNPPEENLAQENVPQDLFQGDFSQTLPQEDLARKELPQADQAQEELPQEDLPKELPREYLSQESSQEGLSRGDIHEDLLQEDVLQEQPVEVLPKEDILEETFLQEDLPKDDPPKDLALEGLSEDLPGTFYQEGPPKDDLIQALPREKPPPEPPQEDLSKDLPVEALPKVGVSEEDLLKVDLPKGGLLEDLPKDLPQDLPQDDLPQDDLLQDDLLQGLLQEGLLQEDPHRNPSTETLPQVEVPEEVSPREDLHDMPKFSSWEDMPQELPQEDPLKDPPTGAPPQEDILQEILYQGDVPKDDQLQDLPREDESKEPSQEPFQEPSQEGLVQDLPVEVLPQVDVPEEVLNQNDMPKEDPSKEDLPKNLSREDPFKEDLRQDGLPQDLLREDLAKEDLPKEDPAQTQVSELVQDTISQKELGQVTLPQEVEAGPSSEPTAILESSELTTHDDGTKPDDSPNNDLPIVPTKKSKKDRKKKKRASSLGVESTLQEEPTQHEESQPLVDSRPVSEVVSDNLKVDDMIDPISSKKIKKDEEKESLVAFNPDPVEESVEVDMEPIHSSVPDSTEPAQVETALASSSRDVETNSSTKDRPSPPQASMEPNVSINTPVEALQSEGSFESTPGRKSKKSKKSKKKRASVGEFELEPEPEVQTKNIPDLAAEPAQAVEQREVTSTKLPEEPSSYTKGQEVTYQEAEAHGQEVESSANNSTQVSEPTNMEETALSEKFDITRESNIESGLSGIPIDTVPEYATPEHSFEHQQTAPQTAEDIPLHEVTLETAPKVEDKVDTGLSKKSKKDKKKKKRASQVSWESGPDAEIGDVPEQRQSGQALDEQPRTCEPTETDNSGNAEDPFSEEHPSGEEFEKNNDRHSQLNWELEQNSETPVEEPKPLPPTGQGQYYDMPLDHQSLAEDTETSLNISTDLDDTSLKTTSSKKSKETSQTYGDPAPATATSESTTALPPLEQTVADKALEPLDAPTILDDRTIAGDVASETVLPESQNDKQEAKEQAGSAQLTEIPSAIGYDTTNPTGFEATDEPVPAADATHIFEAPDLSPEDDVTEEQPHEILAEEADSLVKEAKQFEELSRPHSTAPDPSADGQDAQSPSPKSEEIPEIVPDVTKDTATTIPREQPENSEPSTKVSGEDKTTIEQVKSNTGITVPSWDSPTVDDEIQTETPVPETVVTEIDASQAESVVTAQPSDASQIQSQPEQNEGPIDAEFNSHKQALGESQPARIQPEEVSTSQEEPTVHETGSVSGIQTPQPQYFDGGDEPREEIVPGPTTQVAKPIDAQHDDHASVRNSEPQEDQLQPEASFSGGSPLELPTIPDVSQELTSVGHSILDEIWPGGGHSTKTRASLDDDVPVHPHEQASVAGDDIPDNKGDVPHIAEVGSMTTPGSPPRTPSPNRRAFAPVDMSPAQLSSHIEHDRPFDQTTQSGKKLRTHLDDDDIMLSEPLTPIATELPASMPKESDPEETGAPAKPMPSTAVELDHQAENGPSSDFIVQEPPVVHSEADHITVGNPQATSNTQESYDIGLTTVHDKEVTEGLSENKPEGKEKEMDSIGGDETVEVGTIVRTDVEENIGVVEELDRSKVKEQEESESVKVLEEDGAFDGPVPQDGAESKMPRDSKLDVDSGDIQTESTTEVDKQSHEAAGGNLDSATISKEVSEPTWQKVDAENIHVNNSPEGKDIVPDILRPSDVEIPVPETKEINKPAVQEITADLATSEQVGSDHGFLNLSERDAPEEPSFIPSLPPLRTPSVLEYGRASPRSLAPVEEETREELEKALQSDPRGKSQVGTEQNRDSEIMTRFRDPQQRSPGFEGDPGQRDSGVHMHDWAETKPEHGEQITMPQESSVRAASSSPVHEGSSSLQTPPPSERRSRRSLFDSETPKLSTPTQGRAWDRIATPEQTAEDEPLKRTTTPLKPLATKQQDLGSSIDAGATLRGPHTPQRKGTSNIAEDIRREATPQLDNSAQRPASNPTISRFRTPEPHKGRTDSPSSHSVHSVHSVHSIHSIHSMRSLRSSGANTPPLRRRDRRISGDLRSLSHNSASSTSLPGSTQDKDTADRNTTIRGGALDRSDRSDRRAPDSLNNTTPIANEGRVRAKDMTDIYDGYGEGRIGSPRSPTRPPSMRRRQSMQVLELESKVEQLLVENRALADARVQAEQSLTQRNTSAITDRDAEIESLKASLQWLRNEVTRLTEVNEGLQSANNLLALQHNEKYTQLKSKHTTTTRELEEYRGATNKYTQNLQEKDAEIEALRRELEATKEQIREMQRQILATKPPDADFLRLRDEDHFDHRCQQLCSHVQQWILRFSKFSDMRACRLTKEINDEKIVDRLDNTILDGSDVDDYLSDRVARRDIFMSMTMNMIWEFVFTRYLFGMDREQRQKLKSLEKILTEVGPPHAVRQWRAITLTLLSRRPAFGNQRNQDTEAVVQAILHTLSMILPPPSNLEAQIQSQLRRVMREAVDLSIEMRTHRAEYIMLPPTQPEYDANGELVETVAFNAALMHERSGDSTKTNESYEAQGAIVRCVLFPLVAKKGDDNGVGDEEIVVYPAQVLVAKARRSTIRLVTPSSDAGGVPLSRGATPSAVSMNLSDTPLTPEYV